MWVAPGCPRWSRPCAMAMPIMLTSREMIAGAFRPTGSENGGSQILAGNGAVWWKT